MNDISARPNVRRLVMEALRQWGIFPPHLTAKALSFTFLTFALSEDGLHSSGDSYGHSVTEERRASDRWAALHFQGEEKTMLDKVKKK